MGKLPGPIVHTTTGTINGNTASMRLYGVCRPLTNCRTACLLPKHNVIILRPGLSTPHFNFWLYFYPLFHYFVINVMNLRDTQNWVMSHTLTIYIGPTLLCNMAMEQGKWDKAKCRLLRGINDGAMLGSDYETDNETRGHTDRPDIHSSPGRHISPEYHLYVTLACTS